MRSEEPQVTNDTNGDVDDAAPTLFTPLALRGLTLRNRVVVSPMCQYSSDDGFINDWHFVHLGSRAVGGASLVLMEATGVEARGRTSPRHNRPYPPQHPA